MKRPPRQQQLNLTVKEEQLPLFQQMEATPRIVQFESICGCNANCSFCPYPTMRRPRGQMAWPMIEQIIAQSDGATSLIPFLLGEPLLDPRLRQILALCKQQQPQAATVLYSNMSRCDHDVASWLVQDQTVNRICPSFYGPNPLVYRQLQPPLDYHTVRRNIIHLAKLRQAAGQRYPIIDMQYILMDLTEPHFAQFRDYWQAIVDQVSPVNFDTWHGLVADRSVRPAGPPLPGPIPCSRLWEGINIHHDGTAVACCIDLEQQAVIGHFPQQSLAEIWHGQPLRILRRLHLAGQQARIPLCRDCTSWRSGPPWWVKFWTQALYGR